VYGDDPPAVAKQFLSAGARWVHVVDLDAARSGQRTNAQAIAGVAAVCRQAGASMELGGGIRDDAAVQAALELGASRVIIGSAALKDWPWFERLVRRGDLAGKVALGLDARGGLLAAHGWTEQSALTVLAVAQRCVGLPVSAVIYTDIQRDGMFSGPDLATTRQLVELGLPVIASGGVGSLDDIARCKEIGCLGTILGRAYYEGKVDLAAACRLASAGPSAP
jgi:phosphoribosylformimino-5-aminoimidazole carboxamide ribotide isomerase